MICLKCEISESDQATLIFRLIHKKCSGHNASKIKVMKLRGKRALKCSECSQELLQVPNIFKVMDELKHEIK